MSNTQTRKHTGKNESSRRQLTYRCERLLQTQISCLQYPGGKSRDSIRLVLKKGEAVIASKRSDKFRAGLEGKVLGTLAPMGASVPRLLAYDRNDLLIQEEIIGERLALALNQQDEARVELLLDSALANLANAQQSGSKAGFDQDLPLLGATEHWLAGLIERPAIIGKHLNIPAPPLNKSELFKLLEIRKPRFVKWDARPGNAMVTSNDVVMWFDWEHCGLRNRMDDVAWLLADEFVPNYPLVEERLLEKHLTNFADDLNVDEARHYLMAFGVFHSTVRLGLVLKHKRDKDWWDYNYCLQGDKVGVTIQTALRICARAARWSRQTPYTEALGPWFETIADRIGNL